MTPLRTVALRLALVSALSAAAYAKPNFAGTWKLDSANSDFGPMPGPSSMTRVIQHEEPSIQIKTTQVGQRGELTTELKYTTDGKDSINKTQMGEVKSNAVWEGDILVVKYKINSPQAGEIDIEDRWALTNEGKGSTVTSKIKGSFGEVERKLVFTKE